MQFPWVLAAVEELLRVNVGVGKGGKKVGRGVEKAVSPHSDGNGPEQKP